jgi:D-alanine-D-alanine ligase
MKPKIAVLMGGHSLEREISLQSGKRVAAALKRLGYRVAALDVDEHIVTTLKREKADMCFIALHGKFGEDGTIQELLEIMGLPYTGAGVLASMFGMDKALSKEIFKRDGIPTPPFFSLSVGAIKEMGASNVLKDVVADLGLPIVVKPSSQGSALGIKMIETDAELPAAILSALSYDDKVILEKYIKGVEVAVSVLGVERPHALPAVEIVPKKHYFDFEAMYTMGKTDYFVPARIPDETFKQVQHVAVKVFKSLQCKDMGRVDFIIGKDDVPYVLELNTIPGLTETSLLPMAAQEAGMEFDELVEKIVEYGRGSS